MPPRYVDCNQIGTALSRLACGCNEPDETWLEQAEAEAEIEADWERDDDAYLLSSSNQDASA